VHRFGLPMVNRSSLEGGACAPTIRLSWKYDSSLGCPSQNLVLDASILERTEINRGSEDGICTLAHISTEVQVAEQGDDSTTQLD
jgi:hypothetical protein